MRAKIMIVASLVLMVLAVAGCPPDNGGAKATKTGSHETISFSAPGTDVTFAPTPGSPPASQTLTATVQTYDDFSDGTSKLAAPPGVKGAVITITSDDATNACIKLSNNSITTGGAGTATVTASAAAARVTTCTAQITATYATARNSPQVVNIRNRAP